MASLRLAVALSCKQVTPVLEPALFEQIAARAFARCDSLASHTEEPGRITRTFLSPALRAAHDQLSVWMREAGMSVRVDALGNLIGRYPNNDESMPAMVIGSHLDTVPNGGRYDGPLGVLLGLALVELLPLTVDDLPFAIEVIGFSDEEGVRFGVPYLGSRAIAGTFDSRLLERCDASGVSMAEAIAAFGLEPDWQSARRKPDDILAYLEAHIEQGPALERLGQPLAVVSTIAGQSRCRVHFCGQPGHAGTLSMTGRRDALAAAAEWVLAVEKGGAKISGAVATVGALTVTPNAGNVVPGAVECSLDVRHERDDIRIRLVHELLEAAKAIAARRRIGCETELISQQSAVPMDSEMRLLLRTAVGGSAPELVSGAGHDAAIMAGLAPSAMLFLRNPGGLSHCPEESVYVEDVTAALGALWRFVCLAVEG